MRHAQVLVERVADGAVAGIVGAGGQRVVVKLVQALRPEVLVKGGDYARDAIVGAREVLDWGGRVEIIPLTEGASTTQIIAKSCVSMSGGLRQEASRT